MLEASCPRRAIRGQPTAGAAEVGWNFQPPCMPLNQSLAHHVSTCSRTSALLSTCGVGGRTVSRVALWAWLLADCWRLRRGGRHSTSKRQPAPAQLHCQRTSAQNGGCSGASAPSRYLGASRVPASRQLGWWAHQMTKRNPLGGPGSGAAPGGPQSAAARAARQRPGRWRDRRRARPGAAGGRRPSRSPGGCWDPGAAACRGAVASHGGEIQQPQVEVLLSATVAG